MFNISFKKKMKILILLILNLLSLSQGRFVFRSMIRIWPLSGRYNFALCTRTSDRVCKWENYFLSLKFTKFCNVVLFNRPDGLLHRILYMWLRSVSICRSPRPRGIEHNRVHQSVPLPQVPRLVGRFWTNTVFVGLRITTDTCPRVSCPSVLWGVLRQRSPSRRQHTKYRYNCQV